MSTGPNIRRIAELAALALTEKESARLEAEFSAIVAFIGELSQAGADELPVTNQVTDLENVYRSDDVVGYPHHRTLVEQAPASSRGLVRVPGIFHEDEHAD